MQNNHLKVKVDQTKLPNKMHFEIQLNARHIIYKNKKKYTRKMKYKNFF